MKKFIQFCVLLLTFLVTFPCRAAVGESFNSGFFNFTIQTENPNTVYLTGHTNSSDFSGDIVLPDNVTNNGVNYTVTGIESEFETHEIFRSCTFTSVTIPDSYTFIGSAAFRDCKELREVYIPNSVTSMGNWMFEGCSKLERVKLSDSLKVIENCAFWGCTSLVNIALPENLEIIKQDTFRACKSLTNLTIPSKVKEIWNDAFIDCPIKQLNVNSNFSLLEYGQQPIMVREVFNLDSLKTLIYGDNVTQLLILPNLNQLEYVTLPPNLTTIPNNAFPNCSTLSHIEFPATLKTIGGNAFSGCTVLSGVALPENLEVIGANAFNGCASISSLILPESLNEVNADAFKGCPIKELVVNTNATLKNVFTLDSITSVQFGDNVTTIPSFSGAKKLIDLTLPSNLEIMPDNSFSDCTSLSNITFPTTIKSIGKSAFKGDSILNDLSLPEKLEVIGANAFDGCASISSLNLPESLTEVNADAFKGCPIKELVVNTNATLNNVFTLDSLTSVQFGDNVTTIPSFSGAKVLKDVSLPANLEVISANAFSNCSALQKIVLPSTLKTIGSAAFSGCSALLYINLPETLMSIENSAFRDCKSLVSIQLPENLQSISDYSFAGCSGLMEFDFPMAIESIGKNAFEGCKSITELQFPDKLKQISSSAFANCDSLKSITIPHSVNSIGADVFTNCPIEYLSIDCGSVSNNLTNPSTLKTLILGPNVSSVESNAFRRCILLGEVSITDGLKTISDYAFADCVMLPGLDIPRSVESIGDYAFSNCSNATTFRISENVTSISEGLFYGCTNLEKVYFSDKITSFGRSAFENCPNLRSMIIPDGVKAIPTKMMSGCTSLSEILIPNSVTSIEQAAFSGCSSLKNIDLGTGVYEIADKAFENCSSIKDLHSMALNPPYAEMYSFPIESYNNATVTVQEQSLSKYNQQNPWYRFANYLTVSGAVTLSHYAVDMAGNEVFQLGVYGAKSEIEWSSSNPTVAYANKCGLIVAMGITGSTTITAHVDGEEINCRVTVSATQRPSSSKAHAQETDAENDPVDVIIESIEGNPPMVNARLIPVGSCTVIDWTSSDDAVATVINGLVNVINEGEVEIGVDTENGLSENFDVETKDIEHSGIENVVIESAITEKGHNVYDFMGRCIIYNATEDQIKHLTPGVYIIGKKKIYVK